MFSDLEFENQGQSTSQKITFSEAIERLQSSLRAGTRAETKELIRIIVQFLRDKISGIRSVVLPVKSKIALALTLAKDCDQCEDILFTFLPAVQNSLRETRNLTASEIAVDTEILLKLTHLKNLNSKLDENWKEWLRLQQTNDQEFASMLIISNQAIEESRTRGVTVNNMDLLDAARSDKLELLEKQLQIDITDVNFKGFYCQKKKFYLLFNSFFFVFRCKWINGFTLGSQISKFAVHQKIDKRTKHRFK